MTNLIRSNFQAHPFHLVSPSPWPLFTCIALLTLTTAGGFKPYSTNNYKPVKIYPNADNPNY
jgi:cytochrome c oxidase subunit 3